jgi:hypothetical protein
VVVVGAAKAYRHKWRSTNGKIRLREWPGAQVVVPRQALEALSGWLQAPVCIEVIPRSAVRQLWQRDFGSAAFPGQYAFRAFTRGHHVRLVSDHTETPASLTWLLLHELAHVLVNESPMLDEALRSVPKPEGYLTNDAAHEAWPEEQLANLVANQFACRVGSRPGLDRLWWRRRVQRLVRPSGRSG